MNPISTIENFDGADGFFGQVALLEKRASAAQDPKPHQGKHEAFERYFLCRTSYAWWSIACDSALFVAKCGGFGLDFHERRDRR